MSKANLEFSSDRKLLIFTPTGGKPVELNTIETEELIVALIAMRAEMHPRRTSTDPFEGTALLSHPGMRWYIAPHPSGPGHAQICMMHPGLGWMGFAIDREGGKKVISEIQKAHKKQ